MIQIILASKQMVYKVFENVIGALEEIESRESKARKQKALPKSKIQYADQSKRNDLDVCILCFESEFWISYLISIMPIPIDVSMRKRNNIEAAPQQLTSFLQVQRQLETQLVLFEAQMVSCAPEIKEAVRQELTKVTLKWIGTRQENELTNGAVDGYTGHLLRILTEGKTEHPEVFNQMWGFFFILFLHFLMLIIFI